MENSETTVWALMGSIDYEGQHLLGVFSSKEKATAAEMEFRNRWPGIYDEYEIESSILDQVDR